MAIWEKIRRGWDDPEWWVNTAAPYAYRQGLQMLGDAYWASKSTDRIHIPTADWDTLCILDACRYDTFRSISQLDGNLEKRYSLAPQTPIFLKKNFSSGVFHNTVYVTGNPHVKRQLSDDQFHAVYHVWDTDWDQDLKSVHPEAIRDATLRALEAHPNKRVIAHFMQPHAPFIGEWARKEVGIYCGIEHAHQSALHGDYNVDTTNPYVLLEQGELDPATVRRAYEENLEVALPYVEEILDSSDGKTVVTADHGEMFGERAWPYPWKGFQHPPIPAKSLLEVPWLEHESGPRRDVISEPPIEEGIKSETEESDIENRLEALGYK